MPTKCKDNFGCMLFFFLSTVPWALEKINLCATIASLFLDNSEIKLDFGII